MNTNPVDIDYRLSTSLFLTGSNVKNANKEKDEDNIKDDANLLDIAWSEFSCSTLCCSS